MAQAGDGLGLTLQAFPQLGAPGQVGRQDLDGDRAPEARVLGAVHLAHTPGSDGAEDLVGAELRA